MASSDTTLTYHGYYDYVLNIAASSAYKWIVGGGE